MNLDKKNHVIAIFLDLSKTFDTVDNELLLIKLKYYDLSKESLDLIVNYLTEHYSLINFENCQS